MPPQAPASTLFTTTSPPSGEDAHNDTIATTDAAAASTSYAQQQITLASQHPHSTNPLLASSPSSIDMYVGGVYGGGGMYGAGMMGGAGMYGGGYGGMYGGGYGGGMMLSPYGAGGPVHSLHQFLFGIQQIVCSLTQAVQIVGMNTEAVQSLMTHMTALLEHAMGTWNELRVLEQQQRNNREEESLEQRRRRRRLRTMRWMLTTVGTYAAYKVLQYCIAAAAHSGRRRRKRHALA